jgi:hypothetical protein
MNRAWVFQERLLSPRSIYIVEKVHWECCELQACEAFPEGSPIPICTSPWGMDGHPFRLMNILNDDKYSNLLWHIKFDRGERSTEGTRTRETYRKWLFVAESFSRCRLTYQQDLFPALSGLARSFQAQLGDQYAAGLWHRDITQGLYWVCAIHAAYVRVKEYRGKLRPRCL